MLVLVLESVTRHTVLSVGVGVGWVLGVCCLLFILKIKSGIHPSTPHSHPTPLPRAHPLCSPKNICAASRELAHTCARVSSHRKQASHRLPAQLAEIDCEEREPPCAATD